ncbi:MAG: GNAT family N-acetyltransferase [Acidimicrobiia bacterium]
MIVRRATLDDLDILLTLAAEFNDIDRHDHDPVRVRAAMQPLLVSDDLGVVYLFGDGLGYALVTWGYSIESGGRDALLDEIYTRERGEGRGGELLVAVLEDLAQRGLPRVFLETEAHNKAVRRFYTRHGFRTEDSIWMTRDLWPLS